MILQALSSYYDILAAEPDSEIAPPGYSLVSVSYALNLSRDGQLLQIFPLIEQVQRGKKTVDASRRMIVPEQVKRSVNISPNYLCDNATYVLGLLGKEVASEGYIEKRFAAFRTRNLDLLKLVDCLEARALIAFLEQHPPGAVEHPAIAPHLEGLLKGGNLVFRLDGGKGFIQDTPAIRTAWEKSLGQADAATGQCLVTGETAPIARLHPSIRRLKDANPTGATLVGFNASAYESYNLTQGLNAPVSQQAVFAYTTALNYLLSPENPHPRLILGDTTVVYWAESSNPGYASLFASLIEPANDETPEDNPQGVTSRDRDAESRLAEVAKKIRQAGNLDKEMIQAGLEPQTRFHVLGLAPNSARIAVRFYYSDPFSKLVQKVSAHYSDMQIAKEYVDQQDGYSIMRIVGETVSKKSSDPKPSPLMSGALMRAILENRPYPAALYNTLITRVRVDADDKDKHVRKLGHLRAGLLKGYLLRKYRQYPNSPIMEALHMALNETSSYPPYLLGRLFAVLEKAQQDAAGDTKLNATIKDRYFTAACATPATVFPVLLRLAQHHISKAEYGYTSDKKIEQILNLLDLEENPIPSHLNLDEQGAFMLGYYHQRAAFYQKPANPVSTSQA